MLFLAGKLTIDLERKFKIDGSKGADWAEKNASHFRHAKDDVETYRKFASPEREVKKWAV